MPEAAAAATRMIMIAPTSDPRSSQATWTVEQQLFGYADQISVALEANDIDGVERLCTETRSVLAQRNVACKAAKRYQG